MAEVKNKPNTEEAAVLTENEINEQMQVRIDKMHKIEEHGWKPFGYRFLYTHRAADIAAQFDELSEKETEVKMAGRIMAIRGHGKPASWICRIRPAVSRYMYVKTLSAKKTMR